MTLRPVPATISADLVNVVVAYQQATETAMAAPRNPTATIQLASYADGEELDTMRQQLASMVRDGLVARGHVPMHPLVLFAEANLAAVENCAAQGAVHLLHASTGEPAENPNSGVAMFEYNLHRVESTWHVDKVVIATGDDCPTERR